MAREWLICTQHNILVTPDDRGSCPKCKGDRNLIVVVQAGSSPDPYVDADARGAKGVQKLLACAIQLGHPCNAATRARLVEEAKKCAADLLR